MQTIAFAISPCFLFLTGPELLGTILRLRKKDHRQQIVLQRLLISKRWLKSSFSGKVSCSFCLLLSVVGTGFLPKTDCGTFSLQDPARSFDVAAVSICLEFSKLCPTWSFEVHPLFSP